MQPGTAARQFPKPPDRTCSPCSELSTIGPMSFEPYARFAKPRSEHSPRTSVAGSACKTRISNILDAYDCVHVPISDRRGRILDAQALSVRSVTVQFPCGHTSSSGNTFESNQCIDTASALPSACQALVASQLTETCATELEDF